MGSVNDGELCILVHVVIKSNGNSGNVVRCYDGVWIIVCVLE